MNLKETAYPLVSVVVPAYNAARFIATPLKTIIAQDYPNIEIIVVNDASTDGTEEAARRVLADCGRPFTIITHKKTVVKRLRVTQVWTLCMVNLSGSLTQMIKQKRTLFQHCMICMRNTHAICPSVGTGIYTKTEALTSCTL